MISKYAFGQGLSIPQRATGMPVTNQSQRKVIDLDQVFLWITIFTQQRFLLRHPARAARPAPPPSYATAEGVLGQTPPTSLSSCIPMHPTRIPSLSSPCPVGEVARRFPYLRISLGVGF